MFIESPKYNEMGIAKVKGNCPPKYEMNPGCIYLTQIFGYQQG